MGAVGGGCGLFPRERKGGYLFFFFFSSLLFSSLAAQGSRRALNPRDIHSMEGGNWT